MERIGRELSAVEAAVTREAPDNDVLTLVRRVLEEQYERETDGTVRLRSGGDVPANSLESRHNLDAPYRVKEGVSYRGGYVLNVSEMRHRENPVQLIADVQIEPNHRDDAALMEKSLDNQTEREIEVDQVTTDGGYTGPRGEAACEKHDVELCLTRMRGGHSAPDKWGWEKYTWEVDDEGTPMRVSCPRDWSAELPPGQAEGRFIVRFDPECCADC